MENQNLHQEKGLKLQKRTFPSLTVSEDQYKRELARVSKVNGNDLGKRVYLARMVKPLRASQVEIAYHKLEVVWNQVMILLGFTNDNAEESADNFDILSRKIYRNFSDLNEEEILIAFDMYCMGSLKGAKDIKAYQRLSFLFVSQVLTAYKNTKAEVLKSFKAQLPPIEDPDPTYYQVLQPHITFIKTVLIPAYEDYKKSVETNRPDMMKIWSLQLPLIYQSLKGVAGFALSESQYTLIQKIARGILKDETNVKKKTSAKFVDQIAKGISDSRLIQKSREIAAIEGFSYLHQRNIDLSKYLEIEAVEMPKEKLEMLIHTVTTLRTSLQINENEKKSYETLVAEVASITGLSKREINHGIDLLYRANQ